MLLQAEGGSWPTGIETAVFYDAGKVVPRTSDLVSRPEEDYGFGARHTPFSTVLRVDVARSNGDDFVGMSPVF